MDFTKRDESFPDQGPEIIGVSVGVLAVAMILVGVRLAYRIRSNALGSDDALIILSTLLSLGHSITDVYSVIEYGYGRHKENLTPKQASAPGQALGFWLAQIMYKMTIALTKLSICCLYRRIFVRAGRAFKIALYFVMALIGLYYLGAVLATIFQCTPVQRSWNKTVPGTCMNIATFFYVNAGFNIATDVAIMILPIPVIHALQLPKRQRLLLCLAFAVGLFATATSVIRIFTLHIAAQGADPTWEVGGSTIWSSAEMNLAIICACLPVLKAPLQAIFPRLFGRSSRSYADYYSSGSGVSAARVGKERYYGQGVPKGGSQPASNMYNEAVRMETLNGSHTTGERSDDEMYILEGAESTLAGSTNEPKGRGRNGIVKSVGIDIRSEQTESSSKSTEPRGIAL